MVKGNWGRGTKPGSPPREPGIATTLPRPCFAERSKLERGAAKALSTNRTEQNRAEVRAGIKGRGSQFSKWTRRLAGLREMKNSGDGDGNRRGRRLGVDQYWGGATVECSVGQ